MPHRRIHVVPSQAQEADHAVAGGRTPSAVLSDFISRKGLKQTRQRNLIVDTFFHMDGHVPVEEVVARVREKDARVSAATVYRTMKLLAECGLAESRQFGDGQTRYEASAGRHHHDHLICVTCSRIVEFENDQIEGLQEKVARKHGFEVRSHKMELYGICADCRGGTKRGGSEAG